MTLSEHSVRKPGFSGTARTTFALVAAGLLLTGPIAVRANSVNSGVMLAASSQTNVSGSPVFANAMKNTSDSRLAQLPPTNLPTEVALKDMRDSLRRLHRAALDLINEVEQRDMVVTGEPLLMQPIPEKSDPHPGTMEEAFVLGDAQPPRKKWLDLTMTEVDKLMTQLSDERRSIVIPPNRQSELSASIKELDDRLSDIQKHYSTLKTLTVGPKYKNIDIGKEALGIYNDSAKVEKPWKDVLNGVRSKS